MSSIPQTRDRLGFRRPWNAAYYALDAASTAIPAGQTIVVLNWCRHDLGALVAVDHFVGVGPCETGSGHRASMMRNGDTIKLGTYAGAWQQLSVPIPDSGDHLWALVVDRDNTQLEAWLDGVKVNSAALTQNPVLTANNQILHNNSTAQLYSDTHWAGAVFSLTVGQTPTAAQWAAIFREIMNPEAALPASFTARIGAHDALWRLGEGVSGATVIVNERAPGTDDLTIQGGVQIQTVRTRARLPWRIPRRTWYRVKSDEGGASFSGDYAIDADTPIVARFLVVNLEPAKPNIVMGCDNTTNTNYIEISNVAGVVAVRLKCAGGAIQALPLVGDQLQGGDFWIVCDGTDCKVYLNGNHIGTLVLTAALNLSGDNHYQVVARGGSPFRGAIWNPAVVPATLAAEIVRCACNPEVDPPSLDRKAHDWPFNSATLPLPTSNGFLNQGCMVTWPFVLSGQRQNVTTTALLGSNP